jgi:hypothetical protein
MFGAQYIRLDGCMRWRLGALIISTALLAGCLGQNPPPTNGAQRAYPSVVLLGDSLLSQAAPYVPGALGWYGVHAPVVDRAVGGTGVLDEQYLARSRAIFASTPPGSVVVIAFSGNCFFGPGGGCPYPPGADAFYNAWRQALTQTVVDARARNLRPLLSLAPLFDSIVVGGHADVVSWLRVITRQVADAQSVPIVDWGQALHDVLGLYAQVLWYADVFAEPTWHVVRDGDGIHLTPDGARRAATWIGHTVATTGALA